MRPQVLALTLNVAAMLNRDHGYEYPVSGDAVTKVRRKMRDNGINPTEPHYVDATAVRA